MKLEKHELRYLASILKYDLRITEMKKQKFKLINKLCKKVDIEINKIRFYGVRNCNTHEIIFELSTTTPYTCDDIINFMILTGLDIHKAKKIISGLCYAGISNLTDVYTMIKFGYCSF